MSINNAQDQWEDVTIWDPAAILSCATELIADALLAKKAGDVHNFSLYISKALDMMNDAEIEYPEGVAKLRETIENI